MARAQPYDREKALEAAQMLFWQKGYHATSIKDLQDALKMKPGSIYAAFSSKEALFGLTLDRYFEINRAQFQKHVLETDSPLQSLAQNLRVIASAKPEDSQCYACMLIKTVLGATSADRRIKNKANKYLDAMEEEMTKAFQKAKDVGELSSDADPKRLARQYQSDVTALKIEAHRGIEALELMVSAEERATIYERMRVR